MYNGLCTMNVQIKNMLPKNNEISSSEFGEIILKKGEEFHILCFDVNFDGFLSTRACFWLINPPSTPPSIPDYDDSDGSGYDCQ